MAEQSAHEPTMEEILASIRRIISEDDAPAAEAKAAPAPAPAPEPVPEPVVELVEEEEEDEDVLELTDVATPEPVVSIGDIDAYEPAPVRSAPPPRAAAPVAESAFDHIVSDMTVSTAASAFGALSSALLMPKEGRTIEDFMKELMRPMLQSWLDKNLPAIVEEQVRLEVERISRQSRR